MRVELNGEPHELPDFHASEPGPLTVRGLLEHLELAGKRVAVAINEAVVPRSRFASVKIGAGDRIEIIQAVGGG